MAAASVPDEAEIALDRGGHAGCSVHSPANAEEAWGEPAAQRTT